MPNPLPMSRRRWLMSRRRWLMAVLPLAVGCQAGFARAEETVRWVEGQAFLLRVQVAGAELRLNGTGVRAVAWFKGYAAGLYLAAPVRTAAQVLAQPGPKRLQLRMLQEVPAEEFIKALRKGIERNADASERDSLQPRVRQFAEQIATLGTVHKGDVIDLDFDPARGLLFACNGTLRGDAIAGVDLYVALLRAFIGASPYDERLKAGLLGAPAGQAAKPAT